MTERASGFFRAVRGVNGLNYTNTIVIGLLAAFALGCLLRPPITR